MKHGAQETAMICEPLKQHLEVIVISAVFTAVGSDFFSCMTSIQMLTLRKH